MDGLPRLKERLACHRPIQSIYDGEDNLIQGGVNVATVTEIGPDGITEAFDEPLTKDEVVAIASLFLV